MGKISWFTWFIHELQYLSYNSCFLLGRSNFCSGPIRTWHIMLTDMESHMSVPLSKA